MGALQNRLHSLADISIRKETGLGVKIGSLARSLVSRLRGSLSWFLLSVERDGRFIPPTWGILFIRGPLLLPHPHSLIPSFAEIYGFPSSPLKLGTAQAGNWWGDLQTRCSHVTASRGRQTEPLRVKQAFTYHLPSHGVTTKIHLVLPLFWLCVIGRTFLQ